MDTFMDIIYMFIRELLCYCISLKYIFLCIYNIDTHAKAWLHILDINFCIFE